MPIYEYWCESCKKISSFLLLRATEVFIPYCKTCGSRNLRKRISRISVLKGEEKMMEKLLDPSRFSDLDENNPLSIERAMKKVGKELGGELGGDFKESMSDIMNSSLTPEEDL